MKVFSDYTKFNVSNPVITIGVFDGVHKGHVEILNRLKKLAEEKNGESVVVTFWPHPRLVLKQDASIKLINNLEEKEELLEKAGVQNLVVFEFTEKFSKLTSDEFIREILINKLHVKHLIVGYNHQFGHGREGNFNLIQKYAEQFNFTIERLDAKIVENEKVSSTLIRKAIDKGDITLANSYLGYSYMLSGRVVEGNKLGRSIGFPTANIEPHEEFKLIPGEGVYAVLIDVKCSFYKGMLNIGKRPTVNSDPDHRSIEVHIFDFNEDLYNQSITIYFKQRIRDEIKFKSIEELKRQLHVDKSDISKILSE